MSPQPPLSRRIASFIDAEATTSCGNSTTVNSAADMPKVPPDGRSAHPASNRSQNQINKGYSAVPTIRSPHMAARYTRRTAAMWRWGPSRCFHLPTRRPSRALFPGALWMDVLA